MCRCARLCSRIDTTVLAACKSGWVVHVHRLDAIAQQGVGISGEVINSVRFGILSIFKGIRNRKAAMRDLVTPGDGVEL